MSQLSVPYRSLKSGSVCDGGGQLLVSCNMNCKASQLSRESSQNSLILEPALDKFRNRLDRYSESSSSDDMCESDKRQPCRRCLLIPIVILTVLLCGSVTFVFVLFFKIREMENLIQSISRKQQDMKDVCVPCSELQLGPFEEDNLQMEEFEMRNKDDLNVCCATNPSQTSKLIDLLFLKRRKVECARDFLKDQNDRCNSSLSTSPGSNQQLPTVTAHLLVGLQNPSNNNGKGPVPIRNWSLSGPVAHSSGLILRNDKIKINISGLYYLYSQVYFIANFADGRHKANESLTVYHYIYRYNVIYPNGGEQLLFKSVRTDCWAKIKEYTDFTSYTGGAIFLNAGDEVYVKVSDLSLISRDSKASFLGMFRLS